MEIENVIDGGAQAGIKMCFKTPGTTCGNYRTSKGVGRSDPGKCGCHSKNRIFYTRPREVHRNISDVNLTDFNNVELLPDEPVHYSYFQNEQEKLSQLDKDYMSNFR